MELKQIAEELMAALPSVPNDRGVHRVRLHPDAPPWIRQLIADTDSLPLACCDSRAMIREISILGIAVGSPAAIMRQIGEMAKNRIDENTDELIAWMAEDGHWALVDEAIRRHDFRGRGLLGAIRFAQTRTHENLAHIVIEAMIEEQTSRNQ